MGSQHHFPFHRSPVWASVFVSIGLLGGLSKILRDEVWPSNAVRFRSLVGGTVDKSVHSAVMANAVSDDQASLDLHSQLVRANILYSAFDHTAAREIYERVSRHPGIWRLEAELGIARCWNALGLISEAEAHWRAALESDPLNMEALNRLAHALNASGRTWEAAAYFHKLVLLGRCRGDELMGAAAPERFFRDDPRLAKLSSETLRPEPGMLLARARRELYDNHFDEAEQLLRDVIRERPELGEAQGRLGRTWPTRRRPSGFLVVACPTAIRGQSSPGSVECTGNRLATAGGRQDGDPVLSGVPRTGALPSRGDLKMLAKFEKDRP